MSFSPDNTYTDSSGGSGSTMKNFQLSGDPSVKLEKSYGANVARYIFSTINGTNSYYFRRNNRFILNRQYANGRIDMSRYMDRLEMNGKFNYVNLNWNCIKLCNTIIGRLVGGWAKRNEKVSVTAVDPISAKQKQEQADNAEFVFDNKEMLMQLQQESGVPLVPQDQFVAEDKDELEEWLLEFNRVPEEIKYEIGVNNILKANGWFDSLKNKMLHDSAEVGLVGTYTYMNDEGEVVVEWLRPENIFYSYSEYDDLRDSKWRGRMTVMKISDLRKKYGKEGGGDLTEEQIFQLAQGAKEYRVLDQLRWMQQWNMSLIRPYDEWNIDIMEFELKSLDDETFTVTKTNKGTTLINKGAFDKMKANQKLVKKQTYNIYRCVYATQSNTVLDWGLKENMIRPQDPKEIGSAEFSYSFFMPQNYQMRNMAIPEKIEAAVDGMILALLKMQQVVARMRPTGAAVDESALQNIDYGLGDAGNKSIDYKKLYDQTGDIYYRGIDAEGNRVPVPITELQNSGFLAQMDGLIRNYQFYYQTLKDELGEDPNLMSAALQPRVTAGNVEASQAQSEAATDYIYRAYSECMKITARKISCLLKDSVSYGAKAYRNIVGAEDLEGRQFSTDIKLLPTQFEVQRFEAILNQAIATNQDLVLFLDPFQLMRVAREDVKLAELLYRQDTKKMILHQQQTAMQNQQQTIEGQMASAQAAEEAKRETAAMLADLDIKSVQMTGEAQNRTSVLNGVFQMLQKQQETGNPIPSQIMPLVNAVMENVALSAVVSTQEQKEQIQAKMQEQQMMQEQMQQQMIQKQQQGGQQMEQQQNQQQPAMV